MLAICSYDYADVAPLDGVIFASGGQKLELSRPVQGGALQAPAPHYTYQRPPARSFRVSHSTGEISRAQRRRQGDRPDTAPEKPFITSPSRKPRQAPTAALLKDHTVNQDQPAQDHARLQAASRDPSTITGCTVSTPRSGRDGSPDGRRTATQRGLSRRLVAGQRKYTAQR